MLRLAIPILFAAGPALADAGEYGHMRWGDGYGVGMIFGPVIWLIVLGLVVAGVIWLVRQTETPAGGHRPPTGALTELDLRLARGEIDGDEYAARKKLLNS
ncbi:hypothetical protein BV394_13125 [Brevirhabdus pacifica]|uniref:Uncharacterized protein n=1 Tax=Brevirhabdus pacifica TaxID=1267768 RepID=A0A1U7DMM3_9RHOB|nr:SHOCT domain-containing protein [Brevirhabdus pacifica]APX91165.1 hypothetical protein BV394_13125 [Brevirhabdus pacifica]OWU78830.1 hypothetical protein ATO5_06340 [Loktanella sp. 22II-4b]PJJ85332.1 hypothetical protein CLV77_2198 [Brevirhabdus pacifica]